jgi:hypothetical protein
MWPVLRVLSQHLPGGTKDHKKHGEAGLWTED